MNRKPPLSWLLAEYTVLLNRHGTESPEAEAFLREHRDDDPEFPELAEIVKALRTEVSREVGRVEFQGVANPTELADIRRMFAETVLSHPGASIYGSGPVPKFWTWDRMTVEALLREVDRLEEQVRSSQPKQQDSGLREQYAKDFARSIGKEPEPK
jgi:hypothetical protein